jgi:hypothetical protein
MVLATENAGADLVCVMFRECESSVT